MANTDGEAVRLALIAYLDVEKISQRELARRLGWTQPRVQRRIVGDARISVQDLHDIAAALDVPVTRFLSEQPAVQS